MGLKPSNVEIYFEYICPYCCSKFLKTIKEIKYVGKEVCYCGRVLEFQHMESVIVTPQYSVGMIKSTKIGVTPPIKPKPLLPKPAKPAKPVINLSSPNSLVKTNLISGLLGIGYKKQQAVILVNTFIQSKDYNEKLKEDELFIKLLKQIKE